MKEREIKIAKQRKKYGIQVAETSLLLEDIFLLVEEISIF